MTQTGDRLAYLRSLLSRLKSEADRPQDVFAEAREVWLSGQWPSQHEEGFDPIAHDVLFLLADAREMGLTHEDASALLAYLEDGAKDVEKAHERLYEHLMSIDQDAREALQQSDDYYGPRSLETEDEGIGFSDPEQRRLHRGVSLDPESVWEALREKLCEGPPRDELFLQSLVEDLLYDHADEFIDRIEEVAEQSTNAREVVVFAYVGGIAPTPALERFWSLQERFAPDDDAE